MANAGSIPTTHGCVGKDVPDENQSAALICREQARAIKDILFAIKSHLDQACWNLCNAGELAQPKSTQCKDPTPESLALMELLNECQIVAGTIEKTAHLLVKII